MHAFTHDTLPGRVVFGAGGLATVADELRALNAGKALILCTSGQRDRAEAVAALLGDLCAGINDAVVMHVPVETARAGVAAAKRADAGCLVAIGGGSTIGLAKAIALELGLPILAIPTTYAGSEMTPIWGLTEDGVKRTGRDPKVLPRTVIYDPELVRSLPGHVTGPSGMNAIAHCVEALYAENASPVISLMAEEGIRAIARSLETAVEAPGDLEARSDTLYGAWLAGAALGAVDMGLHHKLCHTLGGTFNLPHAAVHAIIIPHATAFNAPAAPRAMDRLARALGGAEPAGALHDLNRAIGARMTLAEIGMPADGLDKAADLATQKSYPNPRTVTRDGVRCLLDDAFHGRSPSWSQHSQ